MRASPKGGHLLRELVYDVECAEYPTVLAEALRKIRCSAGAGPSWVVFMGPSAPPVPKIRSTTAPLIAASSDERALIIYIPAAVVQHSGDHAVSTAFELFRYCDDIL